jgi:hypothetical protein
MSDLVANGKTVDLKYHTCESTPPPPQKCGKFGDSGRRGRNDQARRTQESALRRTQRRRYTVRPSESASGFDLHQTILLNMNY